MTTPELLDAVAEGAEARGIGTIWVGEHVVLFEEYASRYPYAEDGRIPAPPGSGLLEPLVTLTYLAARTSSVRLGTAMLLLPQRNPVYVGQGGLLARLALRGPGRPGRRRGLAEGGVRRPQRAVGAAGPAHRRVPRGAAHAVGRQPVLLPRRDLRPAGPARCSPSPCSSPTPRSTSAARRPPRCGGRPASGRAGTPSTAHPRSWPPAWRSWTGTSRRKGAAAPTLRITVCPYFQQLTPEGVERYAEAGADAVAALFFAFTAEDVARAFDDLEACREAAAAHLSRTALSAAPAADGPGGAAVPSTGDARCAACSGRNTPAASRRPRAWHADRKPAGPGRESSAGMNRPAPFHPWG